MTVSIFSTFSQKHQVHGSNSNRKTQHLEEVQAEALMFDHFFPQISCNVYEISSNQGIEVVYGHITDLSCTHSDKNSNQTNEVDKWIGKDSLATGEFALDEDANTANSTRNLMGIDRYDQRNKLIFVLWSESNSQTKTTQEKMDEFCHKD